MVPAVIAQIHSSGPGFVVLARANPKLDALNSALEAHLAGGELTPDHFLDILLAGVRALDRESVTAAAVHLDSARANLAEAVGTVTRSVERVPIHTAEMVARAVAASTNNLPAHIAEATRSAAARSLDPNVGGTAGAALVAANRAAISEFTTVVSREIRGLTEAVHRTRETVMTDSAARGARMAEREKSSAKGADFEEIVVGMLSEVCESESLVLRDASEETGAVPRSKKGDFVIGEESRPLVVVEAKNSMRFLRLAQIHGYLDEATRNRSVSAAVWVVSGVEQNGGELVRFLTPGRVSVAVTGDETDVPVLRAVLRCAIAAARRDSSSTDVSGVRERLVSLSALDASLRRMFTEADSLISMSRSIRATASEARATLSETVKDLLRILDGANSDPVESGPAGLTSPFDHAIPTRVAGDFSR